MFGGTFNPPHSGHLSAALACQKALALDRLYLIPTNLPSHKQLPEDSATPQQRLEMTALMAQQIPGAQVSDLELQRGGKSYTVDTLHALRQQHPDDDLWLIMGTDMLLTFDSWRAPRKIAGLARLAVVARSAGDRAAIEEKAVQLRQSLEARIDIVDNDIVDVSSTQLRESHGADALLPEPVADYIRRNALYDPALQQLREAARQRLNPHRYAHTLGCEQAAAGLAAAWGENVRDAREAALLHDITKCLTLPQQLQLAAEYGITTQYDADTISALIHADTGAETARREFGVSQRVRRAIARHTLGAPGMTLLEKIVYLADKCEPSREREEARALYQKALTDLDGAVIESLESTVAYLHSQGKTPDNTTLATLQDLKTNRKSGEV